MQQTSQIPFNNIFQNFILHPSPPPQIIKSFSTKRQTLLKTSHKFNVYSFMLKLSTYQFQKFLFYTLQFTGEQFSGYNIELMHKQIKLKQISHINFTKLQNLDLENCNIQNIQPLIWFHFPKLQHLQLSINNFCCLKPLQKLFLNDLQSLSICLNYFTESQLSYLSKLRASSKKFTHIEIQNTVQVNYQNRSSNKKTLKSNINQLIKLQTSRLQYTRISLDLYQHKIQQVMKRKYHNSEQNYQNLETKQFIQFVKVTKQ